MADNQKSNKILLLVESNIKNPPKVQLGLIFGGFLN